jgi:acyl-coenzyme A thioesterase PaaI-like protein
MDAGTTSLLSLWQRLSRWPLGAWLFSRAVCFKAPYFGSISPRFVRLENGRCEATIKDRRRLHNHIGTVHAIALCNGLEAAMGALAEATIPNNKRWIPKGMDISYTAKATTDITCIAETDAEQWTSDNPDLHVRVKGVRKDGTVVIEGVIKLWVTKKP